MFRTRSRKIIRDTLSRKGRTALVAISILIGVFGAVTLISVNDLIIKQIRSDIRPEEVAMTRQYVTVPSAGVAVDNEAAIQTISDMPGVRAVEGNVLAPMFWRVQGEETFVDGYVMAYTKPLPEITIEPMRLVEGDWPQPGQNQIVMEQRTADEYGLSVGDVIEFRPIGSAAQGEQPAAWTISGIVFHPYWVGDQQQNDDPRVYASYEDAKKIAGFTGLSSFYLRYTDVQTAEAQLDILKQTISRETDYIPTFSQLDDPDNYFLIGEVQQITSVLNLLAVVALVVSGFLVTNVINTIIVEQKRQIGVMKSLGASRLDTFIIYAGVALMYGIIGTIPGVILGILAGSAMAQAVAPLAFTLIEDFKISSVGVTVGIAMGLLVPIIAALVPVFNGTRVTIMEAMTDLGISSSWGTGPLARFIKRLPLPINVRQALSNVSQKLGRLALTGVTLTLAAAAFMGVYALFASITSEIDRLFNAFNFEISVIPTEAQDFAQVKNAIEQVDQVEAVHPGVAFNVQLLDLSGTVIFVSSPEGEQQDEIFAYGYDPASNMFEFEYAEGDGWTNDPEREGIVLTTAAAEDAGKSVGDTLIVTAGGNQQEYEIIGTFEYPFGFIIMRWQDLSELAGFMRDGQPLPTAFFIDMAGENIAAKDVEVTISQITDQLVNLGVTAVYANQVQEQESMTEGINTFGYIFQLTSAVMAAVGAIGLLTTLSMAVYERQKEIGVMRSIGAGSSTIAGQFLVEGILIGVLSWLVAIPLSYLLAQALNNALGFQDFINFSYPAWVLGLGLIGMLIIATVASLWPSVSASRKTVSDILRYQ